MIHIHYRMLPNRYIVRNVMEMFSQKYIFNLLVNTFDINSINFFKRLNDD